MALLAHGADAPRRFDDDQDQPAEDALMRRPDSEFVWSELSGCYICVRCGARAIVTSTVTMCAGPCDEDEQDETADCAPEGYAAIGVAA